MVAKRLAFWDNLKGFLILTVVLGHLLEGLYGGTNLVLYKCLYLFHMPLFVFCSGYLSKNPAKEANGYEKIIKNILCPYLLLQGLTLYFEPQELIDFTTPGWTLWYLLALFLWRCSIPLLEEAKGSTRIFVVLLSFLLGLLCGYDTTVGYYLSLSRLLVFFPFFILGYYAKAVYAERAFGVYPTLFFQYKKYIKWIFLCFSCLVLGFFIYKADSVQYTLLHGAVDYQNALFPLKVRGFQYFAATLLSGTLLCFTPKRKTLFVYFGKVSMEIYIMHTFLIRILRLLFPFHAYSLAMQQIFCLLLSVCICTIIAIISFFVLFLLRKFNIAIQKKWPFFPAL